MPLLSPVTTTGELTAVPAILPGVQVARYKVMVLPPSDGGVNEIDNCPLLRAASSEVVAPGIETGVMN